MNDMTKHMLASLYGANAQTRKGFAGLPQAFEMFNGTEDERKKLKAIATNYEKIVELMDVIQKDMKTLL